MTPQLNASASKSEDASPSASNEPVDRDERHIQALIRFVRQVSHGDARVGDRGLEVIGAAFSDEAFRRGDANA